MAKTKHIGCNGPAYRGAPQPAFKPECINESRFEDGARYKEFSAEISPTGVCSIYWLAQEEPKPTKKFEDEVKRAFKGELRCRIKSWCFKFK